MAGTKFLFQMMVAVIGTVVRLRKVPRHYQKSCRTEATATCSITFPVTYQSSTTARPTTTLCYADPNSLSIAS
jgi:hypothetical protein